jgi:hypothetical protein
VGTSSLIVKRASCSAHILYTPLQILHERNFREHPGQGVLTLSECFDDESEAEECEEDAVQFLEAGEDAAVPLEAAE